MLIRVRLTQGKNPMRRIVMLLVILLGFVITSTPARASLISVGLDALKFVVKRQSSFASTFAVAHTLGGTGAPTSGACVDFDIFGFLASCTNSDFFGPHVPPILPPALPNDIAIASANATTWRLGTGGNVTANASALKGDFAAAGAYARAGAAATAIDGALAATGLPSVGASFSLGGLTIKGSLDPTDSFFGFIVSDQEPTTLNNNLLSESVQGVSLSPIVSASLPSGLNLGAPLNIFWALLLRLDGGTGAFDVMNFGLSVTNPLTASDFEDISTATETIKRLKGTGDFTISVPFLDLSAPEQIITFDEMRLEVAVIPEPSTWLLFGVGILGIIGMGYRQRKKVT